MSTRPNPLKLNPLQCRTLAILQQLARTPSLAEPPTEDGAIPLRGLPHAHGNHFHVGDAVISARDASGLGNPAVFGALLRKGLVRAGDNGLPLVTVEGLAYDTGVAGEVLHRADH
jgi:hypothetical protein